jgi:hypothetical protein
MVTVERVEIREMSARDFESGVSRDAEQRRKNQALHRSAEGDDAGLRTLRSVVKSQLLNGRIRERYWAAQSYLAITKRLLRPSNQTFARYVARDYFRFVSNAVHAIPGETRKRARAAAKWLLRAQDATPDDGVSLGYFPCDRVQTNGWCPSYPETTGYIIPTLLEFSEHCKDSAFRQRALRMAIWETKIQMASGAVQGGPVCARDGQMPAVFNTGMVLHGYTAAYRATNASEFLESGRRAADFLLADLGDDGHFRTHGPFVSQNRYKTYNCLCAWPLYRFGEDIRDARYQEAAVGVVEAALRQQQANGWFSNNCFTNSETPITHTIGYTLQGVLEVGVLADREGFLESAQRGTDPLLRQISPEGFLRGSFFADWKPGLYSSCLTGNAQLAVVCYRLYEITGDSKYKTAADRLVNYLKALQIVDSDNPAINGAIPGSFPLMGCYMTAGYPNWATKYFLDALLYQDRFQES